MDGDAHAGWYPDPAGRSEFRYWDGAEWTEHVSRAGQQSIDPLDLAIAPGDEGTGVDPAEELAPDDDHRGCIADRSGGEHS